MSDKRGINVVIFELKAEANTKKSGYNPEKNRKTVSLFVKQIKKRKFISVHLALGKTEWMVLKFWPGLIDIILRKSMKG